MESDNFDAKGFRQALGSFATGVTIITTRAPDGEPLGLTVNSFNSVSLNPPLVLWSLAETAMSLPIFRDAEYWAVHVLSSAQEDLSNRFAQRSEDKFSGLDLEEGVGGIPMLRNCTARFQCKTAFQYEGGDHVIFVGEVQSFDQEEIAPLVFHGGRYAHATRRDAKDQYRTPYLGGSFNDNFLGYLLGRSHFKFFDQIRPLLEGANLSDEEFYLLSTLTLKHHMTPAQMHAGMVGLINEQRQTALDSLIERGYVQEDPPASGTEGSFRLTAAGSECALHLISAAKAVESRVVERLGDEEAAVLKSLLNRLLDTIDPDAASLWSAEDSDNANTG